MRRSLRGGNFEEAAMLAQSSKEGTIRTLIDSIVELMRPTNTFQKEDSFLLEVNLNQNTISFSPERGKSFSNTIRIEEADSRFSPVRHIELSKDENSIE